MDDIQKLIEMRKQMFRQILALEQRIAGVDIAIRIMKDASNERDGQRSQHGSVKALLYEMLERAAESGLNAKIAIKEAEKMGRPLLRSTAAGLLSRMARDGSATYDGQRYRVRG